jgi:Kef-type K+ transport system membrane component KefB
LLLVELAAILVAAKAAGHLANRLGQPPVLGQLVAGLVVGLGLTAFPILSAPDDAQLTLLSSFGVNLLMFVAGLETDWDQFRATGRGAFVSATLGVLVPLIGGYAIARAFGFPWLEGLFLGVILTATSVSITAQTLLELGKLQTVEGSTILGAAVVDDVIGLVVFSIAIAVTGAQATSLPIFAISIVAFFGVSLTLGPRLISWAMTRAEGLHGAEPVLAVAFALAFLFGYAAENAGLAAITGAYLAGLLINRHGTYGDLTDKVKIVAYGLFVPIFLVKSGMDARLNGLGPVAGLVVAVSLVAIVSKVVGCGLGARLAGMTSRQSLVVGVGMIARGEVGLVVASLALRAGIIPPVVFSAAVVVVLVTVLVTPPLLRLAIPAQTPVENGMAVIAER